MFNEQKDEEKPIYSDVARATSKFEHHQSHWKRACHTPFLRWGLTRLFLKQVARF